MVKFFLGICLLVISTFGFADQQTWYFVRHFEKQLGDNPSLTNTGKARAEALGAFFSDKTLTQIYSTDYKRTLETAIPVATLKKLPIEDYDPRNLFELASKLKNMDQVLIVGHSNTTPEILSLMGGKEIVIEESDYGVVFMLQKHGVELTTQSIPIPLK